MPNDEGYRSQTTPCLLICFQWNNKDRKPDVIWLSGTLGRGFESRLIALAIGSSADRAKVAKAFPGSNFCLRYIFLEGRKYVGYCSNHLPPQRVSSSGLGYLQSLEETETPITEFCFREVMVDAGVVGLSNDNREVAGSSPAFGVKPGVAQLVER